MSLPTIATISLPMKGSTISVARVIEGQITGVIHCSVGSHQKGQGISRIDCGWWCNCASLSCGGILGGSDACPSAPLQRGDFPGSHPLFLRPSLQSLTFTSPSSLCEAVHRHIVSAFIILLYCLHSSSLPILLTFVLEAGARGFGFTGTSSTALLPTA